MKKTFIFMVVAIILGSICGKFLFQKYQDTSSVFKEGDKLYFLQEGVYESYDSVTNNTKNITPKAVVKENNKYHVYVGISTEQDVITKLKSIYEDKGYQLYEKEIEIENKEFLENMKQYDILAKTCDEEKDLLTIEEVVLSSYEDITKS